MKYKINSEIRPHNLKGKTGKCPVDTSRKTAKATLQLTFGHLFQMICGYIVIIILARELGPEQYGVYGIIISVLLWVEFSSRLGIPQTMAKLIPENEKDARQFEQTAIGLSSGISLIAFILFIIAAPILADLFKMPDSAHLFRIAAIDIPFYTLFCVLSEIFGGHRLFNISSLRLVIYAAAKVLGILILTFLGFSVAGALIVHAIASVVALLFMIRFISFRSFWPVSGYTKPIVKLAFPMGLYTIGWYAIIHLDLWCLKISGKDLEEATVGMYIAATNIAKTPCVASFVMTTVLVPTISKAIAERNFFLSKDFVTNSIRFLTITLFPICTLIAITAKDVMNIVYSETYLAGASYLVILIFGFGLILNFLTTFCTVLIAGGEPYRAAFTMLVLIPLGVSLNFVLVSKYGAVGAAGGQLLTAMAGVLFSGALVYRRYGSIITMSSLLKVLIGTISIALGANIVMGNGFWIIPKYLFLLSAYVVVLIILGEIRKKDLQPFMIWQNL